MSAAGDSRAGGFTLVEVVVSLSVLSLILLATVSALRTFANTQTSVERMTERIDDMRTTSSLLRELVASTTLGESSDGLTLGGGARTSSYLRGDAQQLQWRTRFLFGEEFGGQYLVRLAAEDGALVLRWREALGNPREVNWQGSDAKAVVGHLDSVQFAYWAGQRQEWLDNWNESGPPEMLRMRIQAAGRYWPELVMRVPR